MEKIVKLNNKQDEDNYLKLLISTSNTDSKTYAFKSSTALVKSGELEDKRKYITTPGGMTLIEGDFVEEANAKIKYIDFTMGFGYTITFE